jgi:hypothetical protein
MAQLAGMKFSFPLVVGDFGVLSVPTRFIMVPNGASISSPSCFQ